MDLSAAVGISVEYRWIHSVHVHVHAQVLGSARSDLTAVAEEDEARGREGWTRETRHLASEASERGE